jgi:hypothetical protein
MPTAPPASDCGQQVAETPMASFLRLIRRTLAVVTAFAVAQCLNAALADDIKTPRTAAKQPANQASQSSEKERREEAVIWAGPLGVDRRNQRGVGIFGVRRGQIRAEQEDRPGCLLTIISRRHARPGAGGQRRRAEGPLLRGPAGRIRARDHSTRVLSPGGPALVLCGFGTFPAVGSVSRSLLSDSQRDLLSTISAWHSSGGSASYGDAQRHSLLHRPTERVLSTPRAAMRS